MKTLIVYYSFTGNNRALAVRLQQKLNCDVCSIQEVRERKPITILLDLLLKRLPKVMKPRNDLLQYDHVILIAPIWNGKIASPLRSFLSNEGANIKAYSFNTVCSGRPQQQSWITNTLKNLLKKEPIIVQELPVNDLLSEEKRNKIKYTSPYRVLDKGLDAFNDKLKVFINCFQGKK